jgi:hypothetical protein
VPALADFCARLLGWRVTYTEGDEWADVSAPDSGVKIALQKNGIYVRSVWPEEPGAQQQAHLDFIVPDAAAMDEAVSHALALGDQPCACAVLRPLDHSDRPGGAPVLLPPLAKPISEHNAA